MGQKKRPKPLLRRRRSSTNAVRNRQSKTAQHLQTLEKIGTTQAALKESKLKCPALEKSLHRRLWEREENNWKELKEKEDSVNKEKDQEFRRKLDLKQQKFNKVFKEKKGNMRQRLLLLEQKFNNEQKEMKEKYEEEMLIREKWLK